MMHSLTCPIMFFLTHSLILMSHDGDQLTHPPNQGQNFFVKVSENMTFGAIKQEHLVQKVSAARQFEATQQCNA